MIRGLITFARVLAARATAGARGTAQTRALGVDDEVDRFEPYGLQSRPLNGAEAVLVAVGGSRDDLVAIIVGDRRYTIALAAGEVALADDLGQRVHLTRSGIVVHADVVTIDAPDVRIGDGPTYRRPVLVGDTVTGLAAGAVPVTGVIGVSLPVSPPSLTVS